jgi:hypothetical protein
VRDMTANGARDTNETAMADDGGIALYSKVKRRLRRRAQYRVSPFSVRSRESP